MFKVPESVEALAEVFREAGSSSQTILLQGANTKHRMGGPVHPADVTVSTSALNKVLEYEPHDLTISVEAGCRFSDLQRLLAAQHQMVALDPPFSEHATIGGVIATNGSGPLRRSYGTARDLVIGMKFVTVAGKRIETGGMVVKNVAGLDLAKLMIGSFGTLAAVTSINLRLHSRPRETRTFVYSFVDLSEALARRDQLIASVLQPVAVDLLSPAMALRFDRRGHVLLVRAVGDEAVLRRYASALPDAEQLQGAEESDLWQRVSNWPAESLLSTPEAVMVKVATTLQGLLKVPRTVSGSYIARAGNGIVYFFFANWSTAASWWKSVRESGFQATVEHAPEAVRQAEPLWSKTPNSVRSFELMKTVKQTFDADQLLNRSRLYGCI